MAKAYLKLIMIASALLILAACSKDKEEINLLEKESFNILKGLTNNESSFVTHFPNYETLIGLIDDKESNLGQPSKNKINRLTEQSWPQEITKNYRNLIFQSKLHHIDFQNITYKDFKYKKVDKSLANGLETELLFEHDGREYKIYSIYFNSEKGYQLIEINPFFQIVKKD